MDVEPRKKFINETVSEQLGLLSEERATGAAQPKTSSSRSFSPLKPAKGKKQTRTKAKVPTSDDEGEEEHGSQSYDDPTAAAITITSDLSDTVQEEEEEEEEEEREDHFSELEEEVSVSRQRKKLKGATKAKGSPSSSSKPKKSGPCRSSTGGSEAEQRLVRLKKLVLECGVRKPWKKLYEAADVSETDYAEQCNVVQGVLKELGMTGKGSVEQARKIRAEREFADELAALQGNQVIDDNDGGRPRRTRNSTGSTARDSGRGQVIINSDNEDGESDFEEPHASKQNGRNKRANKATPAKRRAASHSDDSEDEGPTRRVSFGS